MASNKTICEIIKVDRVMIWQKEKLEVTAHGAGFDVTFRVPMHKKESYQIGRWIIIDLKLGEQPHAE